MFHRIAAAFTLLAALAAPAAASDLDVAVEHAQVVRLPGEASAVVVGNPSIADALVHDGRTLVVTGRLQGRTNVIALDRVGRIIYSRDIVVSNPVHGQVALFRGPSRNTLSCGDVCDPVPRVGDDADSEGALTSAQNSRLSVAEAGVGSGGGAGGPQQ
jgi:Flp pilus assembly secretin CpaC